MVPAATDVAAQVRQLVAELDGTDLRPSRSVNEAFGTLVSLATRHRGPFSEQVLAALGPHVDRVRRLCALGESALERHWSERITAAADPCAELMRFPYRGNYERLVALELAVARGVGCLPRRAAVLGSGPLPLTGIELACRHRLAVTLVDREARALDAGDSVVRALGLTERITSAHVDVGVDSPDLHDCDLVVHGALVGSNAAEKRAALASVSAAMRPGAFLVVRSAVGLRALLYRPVEIDEVAGLTLLVETHPHDDVVNSVLVARRD